MISVAEITRKILFSSSRADNGGYCMYRIPGIVITPADTVLVYFEARKTRSDWAPIDLVLLRSTDGGQTFSQPVCLAGGAAAGRTMNNPVMIVGNDGILHFLYCEEYAVGLRGGGVFYRRSTDDGVSFSPPVSILNAFEPLKANVIGIGPGHGICTAEGTLLAPVWFVKQSHGAEPASHHPSSVTTVYSLDNGTTWQVGEEVPANGFEDPNESAAVQLSDGRVMLNVRVPKTGYRGMSESRTGYSGWSELTLVRALRDPTCFGSVARIVRPRGTDLLGFVNCAHSAMRVNLTLKCSEDDGRTWKTVRVLRKAFAGYADIACDSKGSIYVAYEIFSGDKAAIAKLTLRE